MPEACNVIKKEACNFIKKETPAQVFSCTFCEVSKNTFFYRTPLVAASENIRNKIYLKSDFYKIILIINVPNSKI